MVTPMKRILMAAFIGLILMSCETPSEDENEPTLESIAISTPPTKTHYNVDDPLDTTGMVIIATYSDDSTKEIDDYTISGFSSATAGEVTVTVSYGGKDTTFTVTIEKAEVIPPTDSRIIDPATVPNTSLSNPSFTPVTKPHGGSNKWLNQSIRLGYETWDEDVSGDATFIWYGAGQGGGAAFKAEWGNPVRPKDFLARIGYFWNEGKAHTAYGNIYCGFNFAKSGQYKGDFSYIGIYGWSRNPTVEYYIVENNYGNAWRTPSAYITNINQTIQGTEMESYTLDGSSYRVYKKTRTGPSIDGNNTTFTQFFSIRQTPRENGTISITEHFKEWEKQGMNLGTNMYECKFKIEVGGTPNTGSGATTGSFDARLIQFYRTNDDGSIIQITQ